MKTCLSIEQSEELIKRGVGVNKASKLKIYDDPISEWTNKYCSIFTLTDLLQILPEEIRINNKAHNLEIYTYDGDWYCGYYFTEYSIEINRDCIDSYIIPCYEEELIDALYDLLCKVIDDGYVKLD